MFKRLTTLASAGALALGLLTAFSLINDRGGFLSSSNILNVGRETVAVRSPAEAAQGSGCMPTTGTVSGLTFAQDVNSAIAALISSNSGASAPATDCSAAAVKGQIWLDTSVTPSVLKQYDGTSWIALGAMDSSNHLWAPPVGGGMGAVTAAGTTDLCASPSAVQTITGTTTITGFGSSCVVGTRKTLIFGSATPLTYNATSLILPGERDYTTAAGDVADAVYLGSGNWRVVNITKIDGSSVVNPALPLGTILHGDFATAPAKAVLAFGQALSRASYPDYFAAVTRTQSGTLTAGNNTIASVADTSGLGAGMPVEGTGVQAGTVISSVTSSTIVMSKTATANGAQSISVIIPGYGSGGDSTTVGVKDCRGRVLAGRDDMGGADASRLTNVISGGSKVINSAGGEQTHMIARGELVNLPFSFSGSAGTVNVTSTDGAAFLNQPIGISVSTGASASASTGYSLVHSSGSFTPSGTISPSNLNGNVSQSAMNVTQPTSITECAVVVLP
jgi:hypothetical protein